MYIYIYIYTHAHTHIYIYIYIYMATRKNPVMMGCTLGVCVHAKEVPGAHMCMGRTSGRTSQKKNNETLTYKGRTSGRTSKNN